MISVPEVCHHIVSAAFEAARAIGTLPERDPRRRLHGHGFVAQLQIYQPHGSDSIDVSHALLGGIVDRLNYSFLNEFIAVPTDENIAMWIADGIRSQYQTIPIGQMTMKVGIASEPSSGSYIDADNNCICWRSFVFEAAHQLPRVPTGHQCGRMHGHGFGVVLHARRNVSDKNSSESLYSLLGLAWQTLAHQLHYRCLNDIQGLENPTCEMVAAWIWDKMRMTVPGLISVVVRETATAGCLYNGQEYTIWKEFRFESAIPLLTSAIDGSRQLFGHSYAARIGLTMPMDEVLGWTMDFGDVKQRFEPFYKQLDHHKIDEVIGSTKCTADEVARWIYRSAKNVLPATSCVAVFEHPRRASYVGPGAHMAQDLFLYEV